MEPQKTWREKFDEEFKHVYHPKIRAENVIQDTKPIKDFIRATLIGELEAAKEDLNFLHTPRIDPIDCVACKFDSLLQDRIKKLK